MNKPYLFLVCTFLFALLHPLLGQEENTSTKSHEIKVNGKKLKYETKTGFMPITNDTGHVIANVFYIAYTKSGSDKNRPITFSFNGGPGSSSVWLHLGALGPHRVKMKDDKGEKTAPPFELVENEYTWLEETDLVFIDPVSTGYSHAEPHQNSKDFHGYSEDVQSVGKFIRHYIHDNNRWRSPKYLVGESYGTTRASGLSNHLQSRYGMELNGIMLISMVTNFQTLMSHDGNDLPHMLFLPTFAASAHYHGKLAKKYQSMPLKDFLAEVEDFAMNDYLVALVKGNQLDEQERTDLAKKLADYTGLSEKYITQSNFRLTTGEYAKELLRDESLTIGRFDSRYTGTDKADHKQYYDYDPSYAVVYGPYATLINDYFINNLGFQESSRPYEILTGKVRPWNYKQFTNRYVNNTDEMRKAMAQNPYLKIWVAAGYYDLATPYLAAEYSMNHLDYKGDYKDRIHFTYYEAGHMMYTHKASLKALFEDFKHFIQD